MIAFRKARDPCPDLAHDARALVAEHAREESLAIEAAKCVGVGMADARRHQLDEDLAVFGSFEVEFDDLEGALGLEGHCGTRLHLVSPLMRSRAMPRMPDW